MASCRASSDDPDVRSGSHLGDISQVRDARERLGPDQLLGVDVGLSRHDAMSAGEDGVDYIAFGERDGPLSSEIIDLVCWWRDVTVLPWDLAGDGPWLEREVPPSHILRAASQLEKRPAEIVTRLRQWHERRASNSRLSAG